MSDRLSRLSRDPFEERRLQELLTDSVQLGDQLREMAGMLAEFAAELIAVDGQGGGPPSVDYA